MKLRDIAEVVFTNALFLAFAAMIFTPAYAAEPLRHIMAPGNTEAAVLTDKPCEKVEGVVLNPAMLSRVKVALYVFSKDGKTVKGCYMEVGPVVQMIFDDGDQYEILRDNIKSGPPIFGGGV